MTPLALATKPDGIHAAMRKLADSGHPRAEELRAKADEFETKANGFYSEPQTHDVRSFMGAWARARRLWCECTGEPLI